MAVVQDHDRRANRVENNFFPTLTEEATSGRQWWAYFDFGLFLLLLKDPAASMG